MKVDRFIVFNMIDRVRLPFRKERQLYSDLFHILGFYPRNIELYKLALVHRSLGKKVGKGCPINNERLEFLGDAILDAAVADIVYNHFPTKREGFLTNARSKLVQRDMLNKLAQEMGIVQFLQRESQPATHNSYLGGNAFEALVGAMYLDRGYIACKRFVYRQVLSRLVNIDKVAYKEINFKSKLIEWAQKHKLELVFQQESESRDEQGNPIFTYSTVIEGMVCGTGSGFSKKESQQQASKQALNRLRSNVKFLDRVLALRMNRSKEQA